MPPPRRSRERLTGYAVVVTKSTVPVGTGDEIERHRARGASGREFDVVSNPEFLREGAAIEDFMQPDRVVVGTEDARARAGAGGALSAALSERRADLCSPAAKPPS